MRKHKTVLYLTPGTRGALTEYRQRHRERFRSDSAAAEHLLSRALMSEVDEGLEGLLIPLLERAVEDAAARAVEGRMAALLKAQTDRLAGLLVKSGKDALSAYGVGVAIVERLTGDTATARAIAEDARLRAGPAYTRAGLASNGVDGGH